MFRSVLPQTKNSNEHVEGADAEGFL